MSKVKNSTLEIPLLFSLGWVVVAIMVIMINYVNSGFGGLDLVWLAASTVSLEASSYSQLYNYTVWLQLYRMISENKAANAPITFEEVVKFNL